MTTPNVTCFNQLKSLGLHSIIDISYGIIIGDIFNAVLTPECGGVQWAMSSSLGI